MPTFQRNILSPSSGLRAEVGESWHLPTSLHGAKTRNNIIITTAVKTSNLTGNIFGLLCSY
jgi:hypothetical protein